jgi:Protein of unknown function (DUF1367)
MARIYLKKTLSGFIPADGPSIDAWKKYKLGEVYRGDVVKPRSYQHHKLCMALLNLTFSNQDRYTDFETFRKAVAIAAGHTEEMVTLDGKILRLPASLSYDALDEIEFTKVFGAMMTVCANLLHDMDLIELEAEVSKYANENYGQAA